MPQMPSPNQAPDKFTSRRQEASEQRRRAILDAALDVFSEAGFAAARLDDVAARAGVAKGTIYLFFKDKEDLFEQIIQSAVAPMLDQVGHMIADDMPFAELLGRLITLFRVEILGTRRKEIMRLVIREGGRFPRIAAFYHREVITRGIGLFRQAAARARARGELNSDTLERFPHLMFAPLLMSVVWDGVFQPIEPLDFEGLLAAHHAILVSSQVKGS
jgi:AcrR family transcriptional regulator